LHTRTWRQAKKNARVELGGLAFVQLQLQAEREDHLVTAHAEGWLVNTAMGEGSACFKNTVMG